MCKKPMCLLSTTIVAYTDCSSVHPATVRNRSLRRRSIPPEYSGPC